MQQKKFTLPRAIRLSTFQIGSAMGEILVTSIWNRVLIANFGIPATPVSFLIALRYLLSPLSIWAGFLSDNNPLFGLRRTGYIWLGRSLMLISLPFLGISMTRLNLNQADIWGWGSATLSSLLYGIGTLFSGSPFLALVRDSAPPEKQGLAISVMETVLIILYATVGYAFSVWMKVFDAQVFLQLLTATMVIGGFFWFFAIVGMERRGETAAPPPSSSPKPNFSIIFRKIWQDPRTRSFFIFLAVATMAAWIQDAILEPFGAEVFQLTADKTTRFNSYWQAATVLTLVGGTLLWRNRPPERQRNLAAFGLFGMAVGMLLLAATSLMNLVHLIEIALLVFGAGFGIYTFGGLSLMAVMASDKEAGAYLGLWTVAILMSKGLGTFLGGALRDIFLLTLGLSGGVSYGLVFAAEALGLLISILILLRVDVMGFAKDVGRVISRTETQIAVAD